MFLILLLIGVAGVHGLDNGLALTPPMGWMNWMRFRCEINCDQFPDECVSENLFKRMADRMVKDGYKDVGYEYIMVDDCWSGMSRDENGRLYGNRKRFPSEMKALGDYVSSRCVGLGLKFGLYNDYGTLTCEGYPGTLNHSKVDAETFAEWGVDYVKMDGCNAELGSYEEGFVEHSKHLMETGRPIVFSCVWPAYEETKGKHSNYELIKNTCNSWRNFKDIQDSLDRLREIMDWFANNQQRFAFASGPGYWNDPDMLIIGGFGLSLEQSKAHMAVWSIMSAPLIMSADLATIRLEFKEILQNKLAIAINQDPLGVHGLQVQDTNNIKVWLKPVLPKVGGHYSAAIGFVSYRDDGTLYPARLNLTEFELNAPGGYEVTDVFTGKQWRVDGEMNVRVPPSGVQFLKLTPISAA